ncbi:DUF6801 domain-containing protein [Streptomyces sp. A 4/2]|uniref:DUF6801 domain-containing protein n=1 Tax=Streptomyces sp. A 4/2 TaxID=2934314 RepID=UPI0020253B7F|nr:DUF6801 domain-containing protein [Streptomyces sp. A 4/2]
MNVQRPVTGGRHSVRLTLVCAAALLAGVMSGPGSAADARTDPDTLAYTCGLPSSGSLTAVVQVASAYPASGTVGEPMQPGPVTLTVGISRSDLDAVLPAGTTAVVSTATLSVEVGQNGQSAEAQWANLVAPSTPLPSDGDDIHLAHVGEVPSITVGAPGEVALSAGKLTLQLRSATATDPTAEPSADPSGAAAPEALTCELAAGRTGHLATVPVPGAPGTPSPGASGSGNPGEPGDGKSVKGSDGISVKPRTADADPANACPVEPPTGKLDASDAPQAPAGDPLIESDVPGVRPGCAYAVGLANVRKLNGAMIINDPKRKPALISVLANAHTARRLPTSAGGYYLRLDSLGNLKLPDAESTFLTFGFEPVSAKVEFENGPVTISTGNIGILTNVVYFATASFKQSLRLYDVKVNGTPLDVGKNCRTAAPFKVVLNGKFPKYMNVLFGGPMEGEVTIPPFSGCGTADENLDSLFTASISGPGNLVSLNQGTTCIPEDTSTPCPPTMPELPSAAPEKN